MDLLRLVPLHTWVAILSALFGGGVGLGWVASVNWKRAMAVPKGWQSVSYVYGTCIILACFACSQWAAQGNTTAYGALWDLWLIVVICGAWTFGTHQWHRHDDATEAHEVDATLPAAPVETGEGDGQ